MSKESNGIATKSDCNAIVSGAFSSGDLSECVSYGDLMVTDLFVINEAYANTQLVKYQNIYKNHKFYIYGGNNVTSNGGTLYLCASANSSSAPVQSYNFNGFDTNTGLTSVIKKLSYQTDIPMSESTFNSLYFYMDIGVTNGTYNLKTNSDNKNLYSGTTSNSTISIGSASNMKKLSDYWTYSQYLNNTMGIRITKNS